MSQSGEKTLCTTERFGLSLCFTTDLLCDFRLINFFGPCLIYIMRMYITTTTDLPYKCLYPKHLYTTLRYFKCPELEYRHYLGLIRTYTPLILPSFFSHFLFLSSLLSPPGFVSVILLYNHSFASFYIALIYLGKLQPLDKSKVLPVTTQLYRAGGNHIAMLTGLKWALTWPNNFLTFT